MIGRSAHECLGHFLALDSDLCQAVQMERRNTRVKRAIVATFVLLACLCLVAPVSGTFLHIDCKFCAST